MRFWILCAAAVAAVLIGTIAGEVSKGKKWRKRILARFGQRPREEYPLESIPAYGELFPDLQVDHTTWDDLDMDRVFRRVNNCQSAVGEQVLYWQLHRLTLLPHWEELLAHLDRNEEERGKTLADFGSPGKTEEQLHLALFSL